MSSKISKTWFGGQFWRRYRQVFSTGLISGEREGGHLGVMVAGVFGVIWFSEPRLTLRAITSKRLKNWQGLVTFIELPIEVENFRAMLCLA